LDWRAKVELFEEIRREYEFGIGTIVGVAKKLKVHRRMVREAIGSALPVPRKKTERPRWKLVGAVAFVDGILESDRKAPRKQRHTAHRIWERIRTRYDSWRGHALMKLTSPEPRRLAGELRCHVADSSDK